MTTLPTERFYEDLPVFDDGEGAITRTGVLLGSPQYMAPERIQTGIATPESDLWSLGATLYVAVEGRSAFERPTAFATLIAVAMERPDPVRLAGPLKPVINSAQCGSPCPGKCKRDQYHWIDHSGGASIRRRGRIPSPGGEE